MPNTHIEKSAAGHTNSHRNNKGNRYVFPLFVCFLGGFFTLLIALLLGAWIILKNDSDVMLTVVSVIALLLSAAVIGRLTGMAFRKERVIMGLISGVLFCVILLICNLIFFRYPFDMMSLLKYLLVIAVTVGMTLTVKSGRRARKRH